MRQSAFSVGGPLGEANWLVGAVTQAQTAVFLTCQIPRQPDLTH